MVKAKQPETTVVEDGPHQGLVLQVKSGALKGVQKLPSGRWRGSYFCKEAQRTVAVGTFDSEHEAAIAAELARRKQAAEMAAAPTPTTASNETKGAQALHARSACLDHPSAHNACSWLGS